MDNIGTISILSETEYKRAYNNVEVNSSWGTLSQPTPVEYSKFIEELQSK